MNRRMTHPSRKSWSFWFGGSWIGAMVMQERWGLVEFLLEKLHKFYLDFENFQLLNFVLRIWDLLLHWLSLAPVFKLMTRILYNEKLMASFCLFCWVDCRHLFPVYVGIVLGAFFGRKVEWEFFLESWMIPKWRLCSQCPDHFVMFLLHHSPNSLWPLAGKLH